PLQPGRSESVHPLLQERGDCRRPPANRRLRRRRPERGCLARPQSWSGLKDTAAPFPAWGRVNQGKEYTMTAKQNIEIRRADDRGVAEHGWLSSRHTFSFAHYYDPAQVGFSDLLVINEDRVTPGMGFGTHPHRDMEIFSYVLEGALEHKDNMGTGSVIRPGDVQLMSAGTGVAHSEYNHSPTRGVHFLQIWIVPDVSGAKPRYQQEHFSTQKKRGRLQLIISPEGKNGSLQVRQDARVYAGLIDGKESATLELAAKRYA